MFKTFEQRIALMIAISMFLATLIAISNDANPRYVMVVTLVGTGVAALLLILVFWVRRGK